MSFKTTKSRGSAPPPAKPRGRPFQKGNPGRPPGSRNKTTVVLQEMLNGQAEAITAKVVEMALQGDRVAMRLCFERIVGAAPERSIALNLPKITSATDCAAALASVVAAVGSGDITPGEALAISQLIGLTVRAFEATEFEKRLEAIENQANMT